VADVFDGVDPDRVVVELVGEPAGVEVESALGDVDLCGPVVVVGEVGVGKRERVDGVVVAAVGEADEFVEERVGVAVADELDLAGFGGAGDGPGPLVLWPGRRVGVDGVSGEELFELVGGELAGAAGFLLDRDLGVPPVAAGGVEDQVLDRPGGFRSRMMSAM
jgi:hypothetical protein